MSEAKLTRSKKKNNLDILNHKTGGIMPKKSTLKNKSTQLEKEIKKIKNQQAEIEFVEGEALRIFHEKVAPQKKRNDILNAKLYFLTSPQLRRWAKRILIKETY